MCIRCVYTHTGLLSGSWKTSLPAPCWRLYRRVQLQSGLSPATERGPDRYRCSSCYCLLAVRPPKCGSWRVRGILDEPPKCCTQIAESHQTPQEPWVDAKTVRNFITSSTRTLFTQRRRSPPWKRRIVFILCGRGRGKGSLRGLVNSSTKGVLLATD